MRIVDIYRKNADSATGFSLVTTDCIQIGSAEVTHTPNAKVFTMADGSITMYPVQKDRVQTTLTLECSAESAESIQNAVHFGRLFFAGMRAGSKTTPTPSQSSYAIPTEPKTALNGYLSGACKISKICPDLYSVELPLQIDFSESVVVPVIYTNYGVNEELKIEGFKINDIVQNYTDFCYRSTGILHRYHMIFAESDTVHIGLPVQLSFKPETIMATITRNHLPYCEVVSINKNSYFQADLPLNLGLNQFLVTFSQENCKPLRIQLDIYRNPKVGENI